MSTVDILIAEDDPVLRNLYTKKFSSAGFAIRTAEDGEEAMAEITRQKPDVLVLDLHMPRVDGFQLLQQFPKKDRPFAVVILTNFADEQTRQKGKDLGADDFFVKKDMTIKSLLEMVERVAKTWRADKE
jgi:DNA-binding response OmpR family regulator